MLLDRKVDKEYAGIMGYDFFRKEAYKLAFGEDQNFKENCVRHKLSHSLTTTLCLADQLIS